ncbi:hypothetical protein SLEP1_g10736 [Rubroshorea leprosula]|uniref:Integrase catalytic domain-containing protein n=1 Tax=Rubroshorea leprosula TaxID=152421 RepID=A0AAV5IGX1_9ROSI|nr:hypothetical protein SLEP1_g10736 [Rubroshorea leprosula]
MQRFNKVTLDIDNVPDTICLSALLHGLKCDRFLDDLLENPPKTWNEENNRSASFILSEDFQSSKRRADDKSQILAQIQYWIRRPPPLLHDSPRANKSKHCDYHRAYGHNTKDCQHLKDELEFLACNEKLEGYVQKSHTQQPTQTHFVQGAYRGRQFNRRGQGQRTTTQNQKYRKWVGYAGIPPPSGTINMISGGIYLGGQSAQGRKAYARQVMTVNKNMPLKRPFEEVEWENTPITFSPADYKRADREPDVMMPHADPFVATVHIGNHNINKLNPSLLQKHERPIYEFDNQPIPVEGVITFPIYVGSEPCFRMTSISFLVVKMESAFNAILGKATLCELKAVISQPYLYMKFPTPQGVGVLKGNQKMARACYQDTFKKQTMSIPDIEHRPEGVKQKAEPVEPVEAVPLNHDVPKRTVKIGTKLTEEERAKLLEFLRVNQDVFAWTTDEMLGIPTELIVHKLSTDPTKRLVAGFIKRAEYSEWVSNPVLVKKPNGKWRMYIDFTNLNEACPKDPHPLPNVKKLVERAAGHERMSFLDASSGYHQVQLLLDDQEKIAFYAGDTIYYYVMMPFGLKNAGATYQKLMEPPKTVKDVQCLTGLVAALHKFIASVSTPIVQAHGGREFILVSGGYRGGSRKLRAYFQSHQIGVYTDLPLKKILQKPKLSGRLIGWSVELSEYDIKFQQRTTIKGQAVADFLMECLSATVEEKAPEHPVWVLCVDGAASIEGSGARAMLAPIYGLKLASELKVQSIKVFNDSQLVVGQVNGNCEIMDPQLGRYASVNYVKKYTTCQFNADDLHMPGEMLSSLSSPLPFAQLGVDLLGPFVKGKGGCTYLIVAVDYFTKWIEAKPLSTTTEKKIEEFLFNSILCRSFCNDYGIELTLTSVYTPQSNGQAESANKIVLRGLKTRILAAHSNWVDELNKVLWSCCTTPNSTTGETPFNLAYGAEVIIPIKVGLPSDRADRHNDPNNEQL